VTVTGPPDQLASFAQACKAIGYLCSVGSSRNVVVPVDGDGAGALRFDFGDTDVEGVEVPEDDGNDMRIRGIGD